MDYRHLHAAENFDDNTGEYDLCVEVPYHADDDREGFHGFWLFSAIRLLLDLQVRVS